MDDVGYIIYCFVLNSCSHFFMTEEHKHTSVLGRGSSRCDAARAKLLLKEGILFSKVKSDPLMKWQKSYI